MFGRYASATVRFPSSVVCYQRICVRNWIWMAGFGYLPDLHRLTAATPKLCRRPRGHACGPSMSALRMMAPTWRFAVWRVMGQRSEFAPLALLWTRLRRWTSSRA